jgi:hypothetical protein
MLWLVIQILLSAKLAIAQLMVGLPVPKRSKVTIRTFEWWAWG